MEKMPIGDKIAKEIADGMRKKLAIAIETDRSPRLSNTDFILSTYQTDVTNIVSDSKSFNKDFQELQEFEKTAFRKSLSFNEIERQLKEKIEKSSGIYLKPTELHRDSNISIEDILKFLKQSDDFSLSLLKDKENPQVFYKKSKLNTFIDKFKYSFTTETLI